MLDQCSPVEWPVVGVLCSACAAVAVAVGVGLVALTARVLGQYRALEQRVVLLVVAALSCCTSALLGHADVGWAAARLDWLTAP